MATSRDVDRHFRGPGQLKSWRKGKTSGDTTRKCSKGETSHLTTANKVSLKLRYKICEVLKNFTLAWSPFIEFVEGFPLYIYILTVLVQDSYNYL